MTTFETIADIFGTRGNGLSTGLPQLDRIAPLGPGHLAVFVGASGVGKSRVSWHIADTVNCTHERGVLTVTEPTTIDALDSSLAFRKPAVVIIDPLAALADAENPAAAPVVAAAHPASGLATIPRAPAPAADNGGEQCLGRYLEQHPVHPAELGRIAERLRQLARRHHLPIVVCYRFRPIRDSVTGQIVSTEAVNTLLDQADVVAEVRVLADPSQVGLELLRNRLGPKTHLRLPLPLPQDDDQHDGQNCAAADSPDRAVAADFVPAQRTPSARS